MVGKLCAAPSGGGSAGGSGVLVEYLVGYAVAEKGSSREEIEDALERVYMEAESRDDLGVGAIWSPVAGGGTRPSSVLATNCSSFSTLALEMDCDAAGNPGVRSAATHFVWSWNERESGILSDEQVHQYVSEVMAKLGLAHYRSLRVVHRDTIVYDRNENGSIHRDDQGNAIVKHGNLHVHVAVGPRTGLAYDRTGLAYDRTGLYRRMAWAEREVELARGLDHDHGLAVLRDAGLSTAYVDWADKHELAAWRAARREERLVRLERRSYEAYERRDVEFSRYADATVGPRLQTALDLARQRGRNPDWGTLHAVAARYGTAIQTDGNGQVILRDVGIGEMRLTHETQRRELRETLKAQGLDRDEIAQHIAECRAEHEKTEAEERVRREERGEAIPLDAVLRDDRSDMPAYQSIDQSESAIIKQVEANPKLVLDDVTAQTSTFTRENVDLWLGSRISNLADMEHLGDLVVAHESVRALSADTFQPLLTTTEVLAIEDRLTEDATALAHTDSGLTIMQIDRAISSYEDEQRKKMGKAFHLSEEQKNALYAISRGSLVSCEGLPGTGKTTVMGVVRVLGEQTDRAVVGLTLSQAAAERLESEAGFKCVNTARARILEERGEPIIPHGGIVVVDEASMMDSRANGRILELARERGSVVQEIYDTRQLQPIDFGASARIVRDVAREAGTHAELQSIQRQKRDWHKHAVVVLSNAIVEKDEAKRTAFVREALGILDDHGAIAWVKDRHEAIDKAIALTRTHRLSGYCDTIVLASDKDTVRHLSEEDRRREGLEGKGLSYVTDGGLREFAVGDRLMFLENSLGRRGLGVRNGDRGDVVSVAPNEIVVRLAAIDGREARTVSFSPRSFKAFDHANATSVYKAQGASVNAAVTIIDKSASAELLFVAVSRSKHALDVVVPRAAFPNLDECAEHVSKRISLKTTSRNYAEILEQTGGKDTTRVWNLEAQREAANLRRVYVGEVVEPVRALRESRIADIRRAYAESRRNISADESLSLSAYLEAKKRVMSNFRKAIAGAYRDVQPLAFGEWLADRGRAHEMASEIERKRERAREAERKRGRAHDIEHLRGRAVQTQPHNHGGRSR